MATSISSLGVGSGLDLNTLLQNLRTAENAPLAAIATRTSAEKQRLSAYGTLKNSLETLATAAKSLEKSETFNTLKSSITGDTLAAVPKPGSGAIVGSHTVLVEQLASAQVLASGRVATNNAPLAPDATGSINLTFALNDGSEHSIFAAADSSLQGIAKAINADASLGFSATLMNDGTGHRLIISSNKTGEQNTITNISVALADDGAGDITALQSALSFDKNAPHPSGLTETVAGQNAIAVVNGIQIISQDNELEDAIEGVTLTLKKQTAADALPDVVQLMRDDTETTAAVENFVKAYNSLQNNIKSLTAYNVELQMGSPLSGDSLARRVQTQMRDSINGLASSGITLPSIGLTTDPYTGELRLDKEKFTDALNANRAQVEQLFTGDDGLSKRVTTAAEIFTKSDGLLSTSQAGIQRGIRQLEKQYEQMESRIDQKMETYRKQFVQLDGFMSQMNGISAYLGQQLSMLANLNSGNK